MGSTEDQLVAQVSHSLRHLWSLTKTEKGGRFKRLPATESPSSIRFCDRLPAPVRVVAVDGLDEVGRFRPEVFFVDHTVMAHHKALNPGDLVNCRIGYKCKAPDHCAFLHKV